MFVCVGKHDPAARSARDEGDLHEIGFVDVLDRAAVLAYRRGERVQTDRSAAELVDHRRDDLGVDRVEPQLVDLHPAERMVGDLIVYHALALDLGKVADALQDAVGDTRSAAAAPCDLDRAVVGDLDAQNGCRTADDLGELLGGVHLQPAIDAEAVAKRRGQHTRLCRRADQRELGQRETNALRGRSLAYDKVEREVLHRGIEHLFYVAVEAVDLVDEQHVVLAQVCEDRRKIRRLFDRGARGDADLRVHLGRDDVRERGLAQPRRTVQQHMVERLAPCDGCLDVDLEIFFDLVLTDILVHRARAQGVFAVALPRGLQR